MTGNDVALDTSAAIALLNDSPNAAGWAGRLGRTFLPVTVVGELLYGALNSRNAQQNLQRIRRFVSAAEVLPVDEETAPVYSQTRMQLKAAGRPIPENDLWIAAVCIQRRLPLATLDAHFRDIRGLQVVNW